MSSIQLALQQRLLQVSHGSQSQNDKFQLPQGVARSGPRRGGTYGNWTWELYVPSLLTFGAGAGVVSPLTDGN